MNEVEAEEWIPYTDEGVSLDKDQGSLRNTGLVFQSLCEVSTIINDTLYTLYTLHTPGGVLSSQKILDAYTRYLNGNCALPDPLRRGRNFTPSSLLIQYVILCLCGIA